MYCQNAFSQIHLWLQNPEDARDVKSQTLYMYMKSYQNRKSTGTRWLWQQNEIPLPHNNPT